MARSIPNRFILPLTILSAFPDAEFEKLQNALSTDYFLESSSELEKLISESHSGLHTGDARELGLYIQGMASLSINPANRDIGEVMEEMVQGDNLDLPQEDRERAKGRVLSLISLTSVRTLAFIQESYSQHEKMLSELAITLDVRPAFDDNNSLLAMTTWQTLVLSFNGGSNESSTVEIALDKDDLVELKTKVETVLSQLEATEKQLLGAGIRLWGAASESESKGN